MKHPIILALAATAALGTCAEMKSSEMKAAPASLTVSAQPAGASVVVDDAYIPNGGFLVIHATKNGKPVVPASIGHVPLKPGHNKGVRVAIDPPAKPGDVVIAMLHNDTGDIGAYEFGPGSVKEDKPVVVGGKPVVKPIKLN